MVGLQQNQAAIRAKGLTLAETVQWNLCVNVHKISPDKGSVATSNATATAPLSGSYPLA